ncbi:MAG: hypothetical protein ABI685_01320 [Ferruginibacter sp.]
MIFTLEVLQADHGDCLLLHYGKKTSPKVIIIDGGPSGIYKNFLKPRLLEIREANSPDKPLPVSMVMVSHMDDDHVNGILALTNEAVKLKNNNEPQLFEMPDLWFNAFDDIVGNTEVPGIASVASSTIADINSNPILKGLDHEVSAVVASTGQGRQLRNNAVTLAALVNNPFEPIKKKKANLVRGDSKDSVVKWDGLKITVLHPNTQRLNELQIQWDKDLKTMAKKGDSSIVVAALSNADNSPFNLSSIVCLVEFGGNKILLTGDARSDDILAGLKANKLLDKNNHIHVDILKMPHHGSERDLTLDFFKQVTADHYVISANGKFDNPDKATLDAFVDTTKKGKSCTLHLTNHSGEKELKKKIDTAIKRMKKEGSKLKVNFRKDNAKSIVLNLQEKISF